jgi:hypothetical protein
MNLSMAVSMFFYAAVFVALGFGWGQWWAERRIRRDKRALEAGRLLVSLPAHPEDAAMTLRVMSRFVKRYEDRRARHCVGEA